MKATDLKPFCTFEERRPLLREGVFFVPRHYSTHDQSLLPLFSELFGNQNPVHVEYCSGNGDWILERALENPEKNWVAVEKRFDRVRKIWAKLRNHQLKNLLVVWGEALTFTQHYLPTSTIEEIHINFPDPWPKARHSKKRLIQPYFLDEMARILEKGKKITFVTDDLAYLQVTISHFREHSHFSPLYPSPFYTVDWKNYGTSWFENLWREKGREILYTQFVKQEECNAIP